MTNRSVTSHSIPEYLRALFSDIAYLYTRRSQWARDLSRVLHETEYRGLRTLTIDFPDLGKHFDRCLDIGQYSPSGLYLGKIHKRDKVPAFLRDLFLLVFDDSGCLREDPDPNAVAAIRQIYRGLAKIRLACARRRINDEVDNFHHIESTLRHPTLPWSDDDLRIHVLGHRVSGPYRFHDELEAVSRSLSGESDLLGSRDDRTGLLLELGLSRVLSEVCDRISSQLGDFHTELDPPSLGDGGEIKRGIPELPKHSAGRVSDIRKEVSKYSFPHWPSKLDRVFPADLYGAYNIGDYERSKSSKYGSHEPPSKLIAVPKTQKGPRLIASEPTSHQWIQQLIWRQIQNRISNTVLANCINFRSQEANQEAARQGSIDCRFTTVDLSSASDRLTCWTLERVFSSNYSFLERIHASRTRWIRNAINPYKWEFLLLRKGFSQGNACTFPVQSMVYAMFAIAAVIHSRRWNVTQARLNQASRVVRVFGDDIIIPEDALVSLISILEANQLKVNHLKTYSGFNPRGSFRESCGGEYFRGYDVTPKYIKTLGSRLSHEKAVSAIEASNNLFAAGWWHLAEWQRSTVDERIVSRLPILPTREAALSLFSFSGKDLSHLRTRWNSNLHRDEYETFVPVSKDKVERLEQEMGLFQRLVEAPINDRKLGHLFPEPNREIGTLLESSVVTRKGWTAYL